MKEDLLTKRIKIQRLKKEIANLEKKKLGLNKQLKQIENNCPHSITIQISSYQSTGEINDIRCLECLKSFYSIKELPEINPASIIHLEEYPSLKAQEKINYAYEKYNEIKNSAPNLKDHEIVAIINNEILKQTPKLK